MIDHKLSRGAAITLALIVVACNGEQTSGSTMPAAGNAHAYGLDATVDGQSPVEGGADVVVADVVTDAPTIDVADGGCACGYENPKECAEAQNKCAQNAHECHEVAEACECEDECRD